MSSTPHSNNISKRKFGLMIEFQKNKKIVKLEMTDWLQTN